MRTADTVLRAGVRGGLIEFGQAFSGAELIGQLLWPAATVLTIAFFGDRPVEGSDLTLGTMMFPGVLGMFVAFGMMLVIQSLAADREDGTLLRAKATPGGIPAYLVSKLVTNSLTVGAYLLLVAVPGGLLVHSPGTGSPAAWLSAAWVVALGLIATQLLGAVLGALVTSPRAASYIALLVMALTAVSGIFYPVTALPVWVQWVAQATPIYWLGLGMRAALLPEAAAVLEISQSWRSWETLGVLAGWTALGLVVAPVVLRRMTRRESGSRVAERHTKALQRAA